MTTQTAKKSMTEYKADSRRRLAEAGGKQIAVNLDADTVAALNLVKGRLGLSTDKEAIMVALKFWVAQNVKR